MPPAPDVTDIYVEPSNVTGSASDQTDGRRSGRTYRMLLQAIEAISKGKEIAVVVHGGNQLRDIRNRLDELAIRYAANADLEWYQKERIHFVLMDRLRVLRGQRLDDIFVDHYALEEATDEELEEFDRVTNIIRMQERPVQPPLPSPTVWERLVSDTYEITGLETAPEPSALSLPPRR